VSILPRDLPGSEAPPWQHAAGPVPWERFTAELLELYAPPLRAKATATGMRYALGLVSALGVESTADLTTSLVARFIASRPTTESPNRTYSLTATLRAACNYAAAQGYVRVSPFAVRKHWVRRCTPKAKKHHSREEIAGVLTLMRADADGKRGWTQWRARRLYALAATVAYTGLRKNEAIHLRVEDIDLTERMLLILPRVGNRLKTEASAQPVPIPDALLPILTEWLPHLALPDGGAVTGVNSPMPAANPGGVRDPGWVFPNAYRTGPWVGGMKGYRPLDRMKRLGQRAGVEGFTFLSLRHSWATHAEFWGLSDAMIQRVLRHTNSRTQFHYRHADADNMRSKVGGVGFGHEPAAGGPAQSDPTPPAPPAPLPVSAPSVPVSRRPKLDDDDATEMRRLRAAGWTYRALMARFCVAKSTVHYTINGAIHREAPGEIDGRC